MGSDNPCRTSVPGIDSFLRIGKRWTSPRQSAQGENRKPGHSAVTRYLILPSESLTTRSAPSWTRATSPGTLFCEGCSAFWASSVSEPLTVVNRPCKPGTCRPISNPPRDPKMVTGTWRVASSSCHAHMDMDNPAASIMIPMPRATQWRWLRSRDLKTTPSVIRFHRLIQLDSPCITLGTGLAQLVLRAFEETPSSFHVLPGIASLEGKKAARAGVCTRIRKPSRSSLELNSPIPRISQHRWSR